MPVELEVFLLFRPSLIPLSFAVTRQ